MNDSDRPHLVNPDVKPLAHYDEPSIPVEDLYSTVDTFVCQKVVRTVPHGCIGETDYICGLPKNHTCHNGGIQSSWPAQPEPHDYVPSYREQQPTVATLETPWSALYATTLDKMQHLIMPEIEGSYKTICGLERKVMDSYCSLPMAREMACETCLRIVNERLAV